MYLSATRRLLLASSLVTAAPYVLQAQEASSVKLIKSVDLPGYTGDFDHFAVDYARNRLLLAAEDHSTLEVFDLKTSDHLRSVSGFGNPHSILVREGSPTVLITDSKMMTDPIWWFYLYLLPGFLHTRFGLSITGMGIPLLVIYNVCTVGSIFGGWLPARFISIGWLRTGIMFLSFFRRDQLILSQSQSSIYLFHDSRRLRSTRT